ncbi:hypothetical protein BASA81_001255 [Batrachochytrium salamandrivorans]|nr:hypothetical protein BASA81_001255 [Batrachochytrium salamandrivorans]
MDLEDESLTHVRNLVQSFCDKIQLKVISQANSEFNTSEEDLSISSSSVLSTTTNDPSSELQFLLRSTQLELKLSQEREQQLDKQLRALQQAFTSEVQLRKSVHDELMEAKGNIRVFVRQRPNTTGGGSTIKLLPTQASVVHLASERKFEFDACIDVDASAETIFEQQVAPFVVSAMDGRNVTLVAYGQTGSGKTYTMEGTKHSPGVYSRSLQRAFDLAEARQGREKFNFTVSILQVYNDHLQDLLAPTAGGNGGDRLEIHTDERKRVYVKHLSQMPVSSSKQVEALLHLASQRRSVGAHALNESSSRSHLVLMLDISGRNKMTFIDLAGSERAKDTEAVGERFRESQHINKSLSCLGDVLQSMGDKTKTHHPFRNSKLTFLLQDCFGRHGKVAFFACISPEQQFSTETFGTLAFAERIRKVELGGGIVKRS